MPFTIFHLGPPLLIFSLIYVKNDDSEWIRDSSLFWTALAIGVVIPDVQGFLSIFVFPNLKLHGFSHTIVGSLVYSLGVSMFLVALSTSRYLEGVSSHLRWLYSNFEGTGKDKIFIQGFIGSTIGILFFHFLPDMYSHSQMHLFWPLSEWSYAKTISVEESIERQILLSRIFFVLGSIGVFLLIIPDLVKNRIMSKIEEKRQ